MQETMVIYGKLLQVILHYYFHPREYLIWQTLLQLNDNSNPSKLMKILTWNCNMNFKKDFSAVQNLGADILFIQECEKVPRDYFREFDFHWVGQYIREHALSCSWG